MATWENQKLSEQQSVVAATITVSTVDGTRRDAIADLPSWFVPPFDQLQDGKYELTWVPVKDAPDPDVCQQLKEWLGDHKYNYTTTITSGGCDTCGYGGTESYEVDMDELMDEIDRFAASFKKT